MDTPTLFLIAAGLAMDAFAVSISAGACHPRHWRLGGILALVFGGFQALMPLAGWGAGAAVRGFMEGWGPWFAFLILAGIGVKMIVEGRPGAARERVRLWVPATILLLAIATSIDALFVGFGFALLEEAIFWPAFVIGIVTVLLSFAGFIIGGRFSGVMGGRAEIFGGLVLITIGLKILIEASFFL